MKKILTSLFIACSFLFQLSFAEDDMQLLSIQELESCSAAETELDHCASLRIIYGSKVDCEKVARKKRKFWMNYTNAKELERLCVKACEDPGDYVMNVKELVSSCKLWHQTK